MASFLWWEVVSRVTPKIFATLAIFWKLLAILRVSIGQSFESTVANRSCYWANFCCCEWPNIDQIIKPSDHTGYEFESQCRLILHTSSRHCILCNRNYAAGSSLVIQNGAALENLQIVTSLCGKIAFVEARPDIHFYAFHPAAKVRVPCTPSMLLSIFDYCHVEKTKINKKRPWIFQKLPMCG